MRFCLCTAPFAPAHSLSPNHRSRRERKWQEMLKDWSKWMPKKRDKVCWNRRLCCMWSGV